MDFDSIIHTVGIGLRIAYFATAGLFLILAISNLAKRMRGDKVDLRCFSYFALFAFLLIIAIAFFSQFEKGIVHVGVLFAIWISTFMVFGNETEVFP